MGEAPLGHRPGGDFFWKGEGATDQKSSPSNSKEWR